MYFRKRGAPVALVAFVACLVMQSFAQSTIGEGCTSDCNPTPESSRSKATASTPTCSTDAVDMTENITFITEERSITVYWNVKSACLESVGIQYRAYYKQACQSRIVRRQYDKVPNTNIHQNTGFIDNLEPYTSYEVRIRAKYTTSQPVQVIQQREMTKRSAPRTPEDLQIDRSTSSNLTFTWNALVCDNVHGVFRHYRAILRNIDRPANEAITENKNDLDTSSVTFTSLDACTTYNVSLEAVNSNYQGYSYRRSPPAWSLGKTTAKVINARVIQRGVRSLFVAWDVPEQCQGTMINYRLTYEHSLLGACEGIRKNQIQVSTIQRTTYNITNLQPFRNYTIRISIIGTADGEQTLNTTTMPNNPDAVPYLYVKTIEQDRDKFQFYWWRPGCKELHGRFWCYNYIFFRGNESDADIEDEGNCIGHGETKSFKKTYFIDELQACTVYRFEVQVVTYTERVFRRSHWRKKYTQTPARAPGVPENVVARPSLQSVSEARVSWEGPTDNPCKPVAYNVTYELLYKDMCERPSERTVNSTTRRPTEVDHTTIRSTIRGLLPYSVYKVCVRGWNTGGEGPRKCVNLTTGVDEPSSTPTQVNCTSSSYDSLTFTWDKPLCGDRKGPISEYEYRLNDRGSSKPRRGNVTGDENGGTVTITNLSPSTTYTFKVRAVNNFNPFGSYARTEADTLVAIFNPPVKVAVMSLNESTAAVEWFAPPPSDLNITEYRVEWWESGLKEKTIVVVSHEANVCGPSCRIEETIIGLKPATNHSIQVIAKYKYGEGKSDVLEFRTPEEVRASLSRKAAAMTPVLVSIFVIIFVLLLVIAAMLYSRRTDRKIFSSEWFPISFPDIRNAVRRARAAPGKSTQMSNNRNRNHTEREQNGRGLEMEMAGVVSQINNHANQEMESNMSCSIYENMPAQFTKHQAIPVGQLLGYVARRNADGSNTLDEDFKSLPSQKLHSQDIALKEENKEKNRFTNILPYDHSRVKLNMVHGDPHSDYINASFIDGYKTPRKYIAAQGPNTASVDSFWRMVWQYDCRKIVMLTNLREANKKKCEKYWPAERESYGDIWMTMAKEEKNDHYTVRYFNLVCNNTGRDVVQYHYTSWPDMGVPEFSAHLMSFVRITREPLKSHHKGPTIVHCSAGVGRTGTFLTLDAMLDQVQAEQAMDIHSFITSMRQNRPLMVQTKKQYRFIYEALLQDKTCGDTGISRDAFGETYQSLISRSTGMTGIKQQFELLQALTISPHEEETAAARSDDNVGKNRFPDKVPSGRTRPFLMTEVEGGNDYINASFLPGYASKNQYIGTQTPLPNTAIDFWRLVVDYKVNTIVMLHGNSRDKTYAQYWPTEGSKRYGPYTVDILKEEYNRPIMHRTLEVTKMDSKKASSKKVKQLQLASCPPQSETPPSLTDVMDLHRALLSALGTTVWKEGDSPLLIHCRDGEGMTGAFCAFLAVLDHLDAKQTIDVFHACRKIRTSRPGAVPSLAQYQFIYEAVKSFMISSSIYENMAKIV